MTVAPPPAAPVRPAKPWPLRWYMWIVYGVVAICLLGSIGAALDGDDQSPDGDAVSEETNDTPEGSSDAEDKPDTDDSEEAKRPEPLFEAASHSGTGDDIIALPEGATEGFVTASHDGSSNFVINVLDDGNESTGDLMVNTIGDYEGSTAFGLHGLGGDPTWLEVSADGAWEITVASFAETPLLELPVEGSGDAVFWYPGGVAAWHLTHEGDSNFMVRATSAMMGLVNEIGRYEGTVPVGADAAVVTIVADGSWTITAQ